jgi:hypothetical protein
MGGADITPEIGAGYWLGARCRIMWYLRQPRASHPSQVESRNVAAKHRESSNNAASFQSCSTPFLWAKSLDVVLLLKVRR